MPYPLRAVAGVTALVLTAGGAAWAVHDHGDQRGGGQLIVSLSRTATVALTTAHDCSALLDYYQREAAQIVGPYGLNGGMVHPVAATMTGAAVPQAASAAPAVPAATVPDSTPNLQVAGVDEGDMVKTSGDLMVSTVNGAVQISRLAGRKTKTIAIWRPIGGSAQSVLLDDGANGSMTASGTARTAVILENSGSIVHPMIASEPMFEFGGNSIGGTTRLTVLDLSDPAHPRPIRQLDLGGNLADTARLVDGELRLAVTANGSGLAWKQPVYSSAPMTQADSARAQKHATAANRALIAGSTISDWLPQATVTRLNAAGRPDGPAVRRPLVDCAKVAVPNSFSGLQTLTLVSADLRTSTPLADWRAAGVVAAGSTLYATADHAWVTTSRWGRPTAANPEGANNGFAPLPGSTQIHLFDTPLRAQPRYVASGEVPGTLLDQFSMDEQAGVLRVASTTNPAWPSSPMTTKHLVEGSTAASGPTNEATPAAPSEGRISLLRVAGDQLVQVGVLTGLGTGERIQSVRFDGDVGYVVTYRQTDPLYTVDLSQPTHPRLRGQLKLNGYSAYLQLVGPGRLLGLGQDGTADGETSGLQLSLFDVGNLDAPRRLAQQPLPGTWSDAEADHHAFTLAGDLALIPYTSWAAQPQPSGSSSTGQFDAGVIAVRVNANGVGTPVILRPIAAGPVAESYTGGAAGRRFQKIAQASPLRTVVHAGMIYTLTPAGVAVHSATTLVRQTFAPF